MPQITDFDSAVTAVSGFTKDPGNETKLKLYALYKQATEGDVQGKRPGITDLVGRFKHDAWAKLEGTSAQDAQAQYVEIVTALADAQ